jgi:hypothetical protein
VAHVRPFTDVTSAADDVPDVVPTDGRVVYVDATQPLPADAVTVNRGGAAIGRKD